MRFSRLAPLLVLSCAAAPVVKAPAVSEACLTDCGLSAPGNCADLKRYEHEIIAELGKSKGFTPALVCSALQGWTVVLHPKGDGCHIGWLHGDKETSFCVIGYTWISTHTIEVVNTDWRNGPLAHEIVHVVDYATVKHAGHCHWLERGVKDALFRITDHIDQVESDCSPTIDGGTE